MNHAAVREIVSRRSGRNWCLFLDRDGVINRRVIGDYVRDWHGFRWLPGAAAALAVLRDWAPNLVIVTNQQGIGKGLMTQTDVEAIHRRLHADLVACGAGVDGIEVCPHLQSEGCPCRKPQPGLALRWLAGRPDVDPALSVMVGDSHSDLEFAARLAAETGGCAGVAIGQGGVGPPKPDASFDSLWDFAQAVRRIRREIDGDPAS